MRKIISIICALTLALSLLIPASVFADEEDMEARALPNLSLKTTYKIPAELNHSHWCIRYSNTYMLMRKAVMQGSGLWYTITPDILDNHFNTNGYGSYTFTNDGVTYKVTRDKTTMVDMTLEQREAYVAQMLEGRPEGVIVYGAHAQTDGDSHAVLITSYENGEFYCVDSVRNRGSKNYGIEKLTSSTIETLDRVTWIYYISKVTGNVGTPITEEIDETEESEDNSAQLEESQLAIEEGYRAPTELGYGKGFTIYGKVTSNYKINKVKVYVKDLETGEHVISKTVKPYAKEFEISTVDKDIKFGNLVPGQYAYKVRAYDSQKNAFLVNQEFTVKDATKLTTKNLTYPKTLKKGKGFTIDGYVLSNKNLKKVTVGVYTKKGKTKQSASVKLSDVKVYSVYNLDENIKFGKLAKGTYYYKVKVTDSSKTKVVLSKKFTVK